MDNSLDSQEINAKERYDLNKKTKQQIQDQSRRKRKQRSVAIWLTVFLGLAAAVWGIAQLADNSLPFGLLTSAVSADDWRAGNPQAEMVLVEYSDFECPACAAYHPLVKQLEKELGDRLLFVYRHFPIFQAHQYAKLAAAAAEAAGRQDKFWEMHDLLFEHQDRWAGKPEAEEIFISLAESLNLDLKNFKTDWKSEEVKSKIETHYQSGRQADVTGTPTFFLNGKKITSNPQSYEHFKSLLEKAIPETES